MPHIFDPPRRADIRPPLTPIQPLPTSPFLARTSPGVSPTFPGAGAPAPAAGGGLGQTLAGLFQNPQMLEFIARLLGQSFGGGFGSLAAGQSVQQQQELQRQLGREKEEREHRKELLGVHKRGTAIQEAAELRQTTAQLAAEKHRVAEEERKVRVEQRQARIDAFEELKVLLTIDPDASQESIPQGTLFNKDEFRILAQGAKEGKEILDLTALEKRISVEKLLADRAIDSLASDPNSVYEKVIPGKKAQEVFSRDSFEAVRAKAKDLGALRGATLKKALKDALIIRDLDKGTAIFSPTATGVELTGVIQPSQVDPQVLESNIKLLQQGVPFTALPQEERGPALRAMVERNIPIPTKDDDDTVRINAIRITVSFAPQWDQLDSTQRIELVQNTLRKEGRGDLAGTLPDFIVKQGLIPFFSGPSVEVPPASILDLTEDPLRKRNLLPR